jgi:hypothetical protein
LEGGRQFVADPPADPAEAVIALARTFLDGFADEDRHLWRELLGAAIAQLRTRLQAIREATPADGPIA